MIAPTRIISQDSPPFQISIKMEEANIRKQSYEGDNPIDDIALYITSQQVIHVINVIIVQFTGSKGWQESPKRCKGLQ